MKFSYLKKIRVGVSLVFFASMALIFLDFINLIQPGIISSVNYLQFIPSLLKFFTHIGFAAAGFIIILFVTMLIGRVYCSSICPLGTLQDIISFVIKKIKKKKFYYNSKARNVLRYSILVLTTIALFAGFIILVNILDPFSNFGKVTVNLFRPVIILLNNLIAAGFEKIGIYAIYPHELKNINILNMLYPVIFLATLIVLVYQNGRIFCNTLCPVGSLLGFFSKMSLIKISIDEKNCRSCRLCERVCKGGCIDKVNKKIDFTRCVSCYNCFTVCPSEGIKFSRIHSENEHKKISKNDKVDAGRRKYISKAILAIAGLTILNKAQVKIVPKKKSTVVIKKKYPSTPPGSISLERFNEKCTACHLCVSACPAQVLQPSLTEYGLIGLFQPVMDYKSGYCNYECTICTYVCPSGAITSLQTEKKKLVQIGKARFIKENCIVYTENTACGACSEHCPTKAVNMVPYKRINIPEVNDELCTGCGACEHECPTQPYKSIYVEGNPIHLTAKKKIDKKIEEKVQEDFPF